MSQIEWRWFTRSPRLDTEKTSLTFTDVLFGLVVAEVLVRLRQYSEISSAGKWHLLLAGVLTTTSYIGYHNSKKRSSYRIFFFNLPFIKFVLDMGMVTGYWWLTVNPEGIPDQTGNRTPPDAQLDVRVIAVVLVLYVLWDLASWAMTKRRDHADPPGPLYPEAHHNWERTLVSLGAAAVAIAFWARFDLINTCSTELCVRNVDASLIGLLVLYRFAKDGLVAPEGT